MKYRIDGKEKKLAFGTYPDASLFKAHQQRDAALEKDWGLAVTLELARLMRLRS